jgi:hypothetical protein
MKNDTTNLRTSEQFDYYTIDAAFEFLPNHFCNVQLSEKIGNYDLAEKSLKFIRRKVKGAEIHGHRWLSNSNQYEGFKDYIDSTTSDIERELNKQEYSEEMDRLAAASEKLVNFYN